MLGERTPLLFSDASTSDSVAIPLAAEYTSVAINLRAEETRSQGVQPAASGRPATEAIQATTSMSVLLVHHLSYTAASGNFERPSILRSL